MRSRSASAAATRRRVIRGRAAREARARKRMLLSAPGPPLGPLAPFVAGASLAAGPPREPLLLALIFAFSERPSERTGLALSTGFASLWSIGTSFRVLARAPHGSLQPVLVCVATDFTATSARLVKRARRPPSRAARRETASANRESRPTRHDKSNAASGESRQWRGGTTARAPPSP